MIEKRVLGKTGLEVSRLALGGLFTSSYGGELKQSIETVHRAIELGVNYIDTAPAYFDSEVVLGKALQTIDAPVVMSTKLGGRPKPFDPKDKDLLRRSFDQSCEDLGRDTIEILFVHEPDRPGQYNWWNGADDYQGPVLELLHELKSEGRIKALGLGGTTAYKMTRLVETGLFDVLLTAANYSILWREAEIELLPAAKKHGVAVVAGTPLQQGALARRWDAEIKDGCSWMAPPRRKQFLAFYELLDSLDMSLIELAHRFVLSHPDIDCVLSGARSVSEIEGNVAAVQGGPLPAGVLKQLDDIAAMVPFRPYDEPTVLPFSGSYLGPAELR
ncbi:aldo/keto reductase [Shinella sp.]|uniref:aldo/keto reductase n=1 Tax=Shinella sp. TaxID=1870904 RepID=UPI002589FCEA|nr:aldo/keto reductase [Shinella sp.]MCW5706893.1 aldo/keto reductase [Shinella sp.]